MRRIKLDSAGMAISAAGHDVTSAAGYNQLIFSTNMSALFGVFLSGAIPLSSFWLYSSVGGVQPVNVYIYQLWYGKAFPTPPVVQMMFQNGNYAGACPYFNYNIIPPGAATGGSSMAYYVPYVDHVDIFVQFVHNTTWTPGPVAVAFIVGHN